MIVYLTAHHLLTPWSRVLLKKLTGCAASQEIPPHLWNPNFQKMSTGVKSHDLPGQAIVPALSTEHLL
jgi:hypothetical protein